MTYDELNWIDWNRTVHHLIVCKQMTDLIELFIIHSNTWKHLTLLTYAKLNS